MLLILRSTALSSGSTGASPFAFGPVAAVPPVARLAEPEVADDPVPAEVPDELAVPRLLVPGAGGEDSFAELPATLCTLPEILWPHNIDGRVCTHSQTA